MKWVVLALNILTIGILGYTVYMQYGELSYYRNLESEAIASYKAPEKTVKAEAADVADSEVVSSETAPVAEQADAAENPVSESSSESSEAETLSVPADEEA